MIELTGENLATYLLREIRNIVNRNPRFRNLGGDVTITTNNMVGWGDLRVTINRISASGTRMSPDYFMCTQYGRTVLGKLENYDGLFIEWVQETRQNSSLNLPPAGVYYLNVDAVNEGTREVLLTIQRYQWVGQAAQFARGSVVYFAPHVDVPSVTPVDSALRYTQQGNTIAILSFSNTPLQLQTPHGLLTPMVDFWYERELTSTILLSATGGEQLITLPINDYVSLSILDQDDYELREGLDFYKVGNSIQISPWTPEGATLTGYFVIKVDPSTTLAASPENQVSVSLVPGNSPAPGQTILYSSLTNRSSSSDFVTIDGITWLTSLLVTGERYYWESRIDLGQAQLPAKKMEVNTSLIEGLSIAIGDQVTVGDQCAILVSPKPSEVYEIYGAKENITFTIEIKANDRLTASEVAEMIKGALLVRERNNMEANGLTIFEISRESNYDSRDNSGTAPTTTHILSVSAAADWELYIPLVTRISQFDTDITDTPQTDFPGKLTLPPRLAALGNQQFLPNYS